VANRKISQFPTIESVDIANADLLTLVHVFEVDPALRNKKITFSDFRNYLDQYYINVGEDPTYNNVTITGNLGVSGNTNLNTLSVSGNSDFLSRHCWWRLNHKRQFFGNRYDYWFSN